MRFVLQKMMVWSSSCILASNLPSTQSLFDRPIRTEYRSMGGMSSSSALVSTKSGSFMNSWAASMISCGNVAENSKVCCRLVIRSTIHMMSGKNPMSSMRSASSRHNTLGEVRSMWPRSFMSMTRPGVPTMMSTPFARVFACFSKSVPP